MAGRGPQTFKKRQKEQQRKERQEEKRLRRFARKQGGETEEPETEGAEILPGDDGEALAGLVPDSITTE